MLRLVPAVLRRIFPFSSEAKDLWFQRRNLGKRYDSYQWQKLFWLGLGMLPYAFRRGHRKGDEASLDRDRVVSTSTPKLRKPATLGESFTVLRFRPLEAVSFVRHFAVDNKIVGLAFENQDIAAG